jgi:CubicO group peptidase (beta-lactamase class C family)
VVLVLIESGLIFEEAFGFRDIENQIPQSLDDIFWIASTSKPLAASAIVALAEKKMLYLDDPASSLFPEFEKKPWPEARSNGLQLYGN